MKSLIVFGFDIPAVLFFFFFILGSGWRTVLSPRALEYIVCFLLAGVSTEIQEGVN